MLLLFSFNFDPNGNETAHRLQYGNMLSLVDTTAINTICLCVRFYSVENCFVSETSVFEICYT